MDVDSIKPGLDFATAIDDQIANCDVMLVVVGKDWLSGKDVSGANRLANPNDMVRLEIQSAFKRGKRVIPVVVDGATMPRADDLPQELQPLAMKQAWPISHAHFSIEIQGLLKELGFGRSISNAPEHIENVNNAKGFIYSLAALASIGCAFYGTSYLPLHVAVAVIYIIFFVFLFGTFYGARLLSKSQLVGAFTGLWLSFLPAAFFFVAYLMKSYAGPGMDASIALAVPWIILFASIPLFGIGWSVLTVIRGR